MSASSCDCSGTDRTNPHLYPQDKDFLHLLSESLLTFPTESRSEDRRPGVSTSRRAAGTTGGLEAGYGTGRRQGTPGQGFHRNSTGCGWPR